MRKSEKSIGFVETESITLDEDLVLETKDVLKKPTIAYETYGKLNKEKNNVILVCHPFTGDAHAAGYHEGDKKPGWWNFLIGPKKALDTDKYFIICTNVISGCKGSTGPKSIDPNTNKPYGLNFPIITINDMVNAQKKLLDYLNIRKIYAVIGGSMGGMQVLQWTISYPEMVKNAIAIATAAYSTPQQIAFNEVGRRCIIKDPNWNEGNYYDQENKPEEGLAIARMIGHITYLSNQSMYDKFGRRLQDKDVFSYNFDTEFQVESYLNYQGETFTKKFDANSYLYLTKALDYFDLRKENSLEEGFKNINSRILMVSVSSDWLYTQNGIEEIVMAMKANDVNVKYAKINSEKGHDAFLIENGQLSYIVKNFLSKTRVKDLMSYEHVVIRENQDIKKAAEVMLKQNKTHIPIVNDDCEIKGIITAWDLSKSIATGTDNIDEIMTKDVISCYENDLIRDVADKMKINNISALPVIDKNNKVIGSITTRHLSSLLSE